MLKRVGVALTQCKAVGLTSSLSKMLPNVIFGKYMSLVQSAPWDRHPYTVNLKQICVTMRVRTFCGLPLPWTELIFIQESGYSGFGESDVDTKLRIFWNTFTWVIPDSRSSSVSSPILRIRYFRLNRALYSADPPSLCSLYAKPALVQEVRGVQATI